MLRVTYKQNLYEDKDYSGPHGREATKANRWAILILL